MATLIQMAQIYPHDKIADEFYAAAVKGDDTAEAKLKLKMVSPPWARRRKVSKRELSRYRLGTRSCGYSPLNESSPFFKDPGGLITGLYNQQVWPIFGYEVRASVRAGTLTVALTILSGFRGKKCL